MLLWQSYLVAHLCCVCIFNFTMSAKMVQLPCKHRSFFRKPTLPPRPANSCVNLTREPQLGKMGVSLLSNVKMWRTDDFRLGPVCSRTSNADERLRHDKSRQAPSHCKLCLICQHTKKNVLTTLTPFHAKNLRDYQLCFTASLYFIQHHEILSKTRHSALRTKFITFLRTFSALTFAYL